MSGTLALTTACTSNRSASNPISAPQPAEAAPVASSAPAANVPPKATPPASTTKVVAPASAKPAPVVLLPDPYQTALDKASSAKSISESAQSQDDWSLVAGRWQQAIALLKTVPASSPNKKLVKAKLAEYQRNLANAKKRAQISDVTVAGEPEIVVDPIAGSAGAIAADLPPQNTANGRVYRVRIKYRRGRIPVVDVTFNGKQRFEMMVDTGASGTMITQDMAASLGVEVVGQIPIGTASGKVLAPVGYIRSIEAGGTMIKNVPVTIGPLDVGLLGHDFFGDCELTIKRDVVEFRRCDG